MVDCRRLCWNHRAVESIAGSRFLLVFFLIPPRDTDWNISDWVRLAARHFQYWASILAFGGNAFECYRLAVLAAFHSFTVGGGGRLANSIDERPVLKRLPIIEFGWWTHLAESGTILGDSCGSLTSCLNNALRLKRNLSQDVKDWGLER